VLISPDGVLSQLPLAALPGTAPDEFLLHRYAIATIAVPQLLPQILADEVQRDAALEKQPSLLLVGGVDYGGGHGKADQDGLSRSLDPLTRSASMTGFTQLPGTFTEVQSVDERFRHRYVNGKSEMLDHQQATEAAFRERAPKYRWLHLSTHGFFAPDKLKNALERGGSAPGEISSFSRSGVGTYHPGLLSGLAMAGANSKPQPGEDDGILTALEVASLDLSHADVVVLSACETGLGRLAGGEGVLGLQRAFQISGAKTVVASLWSVPDQATTRLMQRFYTNLWERNLSKLESLREAQLWLLSEPENQLLLTAAERAAAGNPKYLPPQAWAAFVLSGDWR
jgi:CHAT domain-containing protein